MVEYSPYAELWATLVFKGFDKNVLTERRAGWLATTDEVLVELHGGNVGLLAGTSAGKTIVALCAVLATQYKTLFLTRTKYLAEQHQELFRKLLANPAATRVVAGNTPAAKRNWDNREEQVIFALPGCALNDIRSGKLLLERFDLIVFDEFHHAVGKDSYVKIAQLAQEYGLKILGLSASIGIKPSVRDTIQRNCRIDRLIESGMKTSHKTESLVVAPLTPTLSAIEGCFTELITATAEELVSYGLEIDPQAILSYKELKRLYRTIRHTFRSSAYYAALLAYARYYKLLHAYRITMSESYATLLAYHEAKLSNDKREPATLICSHPSFVRLLHLVTEEQAYHPKVAKLLRVAKSLGRMKKKFLVFVNNKATATYLQIVLAHHGLRVATVFGGKDKDLDRQKTVLNSLSEGGLDGVIATSTLGEGASLPELDAVIHYSMPDTPPNAQPAQWPSWPYTDRYCHLPCTGPLFG